MSAKLALDAGLDGNVSSGGGSAIIDAVLGFADAATAAGGRDADREADAFAAIKKW
jgi:hypothetical protein